MRDHVDGHDADEMIQSFQGAQAEAFAEAVLAGDQDAALRLLHRAKLPPRHMTKGYAFLKFLLKRAGGIQTEGPPRQDPTAILETLSSRPSDHRILDLLRGGQSAFALLHLMLAHGDHLRRDEAEVLIRDWRQRVNPPPVDLVEITPAEVIPLDDIQGYDATPDYVVRYRDRVWVDKAMRYRDNRVYFSHPVDHAMVLLTEVDQVWKMVPRPSQPE